MRHATEKQHSRPTRSRRRGRLAAIAAAALLALTACGGPGGVSGRNTDGIGRATVVPADKRVAFPMLDGGTVNGSTLDMNSLKGKVIVVNIWASWCPPCQEETPYLERGYETYGKEGVAFVGINTRDDKAQAEAFLVSKQVEYPSLFDDESETLLVKLAGIVPLQALPTTVIIDREGKVAWVAPMPIDFTTLGKGLDSVISEA